MFVALLFLVPHQPAFAFDGLGEDTEPQVYVTEGQLTFSLEGYGQLELHDLQGAGGPGRESTTDLRSVGTRSPFVELDGVSLLPTVTYGDRLRARGFVFLDDSGASLDGLWLEGSFESLAWLSHRARVGLHPPIAYRPRRTERYPLVATSFWRHSEVQAVMETTAELGAEVQLSLSLGLSQMRPLTLSPVQDARSVRGTINVLAYGSSQPFSGVGASGSGLLRLDWHGFFVEAFGTVGELSAEGGTDVLRSALSRFTELNGYNQEQPSNQVSSFAWGGGRLGMERDGLHAWVEVIASQESLLRRAGGYVQVSYVFQLWDSSLPFHRIEPLVRYELLQILGADDPQRSGRALRSPALSDAPSWDFDALTLALRAHLYRDWISFRAEYAFIWELNGSAELGVPHAPIRNNELLLQLQMGF